MTSPPELPSGTVTFLFTDIEGSTRLVKQLGGRYGEVLALHRRLLRRAFEQHGGQEFGMEGDALFVVFRRARDAVSAAAAGQLALGEQDWPGGVEVRVRMGLHTGEPVVGEEGYVGLGLHKAARISSAGHGGQVLLSSTTRELVADDLPQALRLRDLGEHRLKDLDRPERIYELQYPGVVTGFAPIETLGVEPVGARVRALLLVEREEELATLEASLAGARSGTGTMLLVEGPAGIGKTSLVRAARERAARSGMRVLHARATELERDYPMGVARQALEPAIRSGRDRDRLLRGAAKLAGPVLVDVSGHLEATPVGILHGLYWLIANLADEAPVVLAVDDAHWADEPSLRFLAYLARRVEGLPVALLVGSRDEEDASAGGAATLAEIRGEAAGRRVEPPALGAAGVERLLRDLGAGPVDQRFARACHEATGGNPFLLGELVRALRADDVPFTAAGAARVTEVTPPTVARATAATLARLGPRATALARAAAVLGDGVTLELAAELAQVPLAEAASAAADLARAGIFDDEVLLGFRHPILTGAVRAGVPARERAAAHARAAGLLRGQGATPDRVALQLLHASPNGDERAVADLRLAAQHATERGAPATAAVLLRRAHAEPAAPELRGDLLVELSRAELATGRTTQAADRLEEAYRCAGDPLARGRAVAALAQVTPGEPSARRRLVELVERTLGDVASRDRELALRLRAVLVLDGGSQEGLSFDGTTPGEAIVLGHLVFARMRPDAIAAEIADLAERAARRADELLEDGASSLAFTGVVLGLAWSDRLDAAGRLLDKAIAVARRRGSTTDFAAAMTLRARVRHRAGRLREAEADARAALAAALDPGWSFARGIAPLLGSLIDQGRANEAADELAAAALGEEIPNSPPMTPVLLARMAVHAARREHARALADWNEAVRRAQGVRGVNASWIEDLVVVADVHRALGDQPAAEAAVGQALELARRWDTPGALGQALHAQARVGLADDPAEILRTAVALLADSPARLEHARALVTLGGVLRRRGRRVDSREPLRDGYELARHCGADALAESARAELRASGIRLRLEALSGADALTPSERRIADMAATGLANAEIAQELFLTVKTVEMHLTNAYRKLDIQRRSELAPALGTKP